MNRRSLGRLFDLLMLAMALFAACLLLNSCETSRQDTVADGTKDRTTVVKETRIHEGTDPFKETVYREEVSKEVAHSEQTRTTDLTAVDGIGDVLGGISTGNPAIDLGLGLLTVFLARKGKEKLTKKKETK